MSTNEHVSTFTHADNVSDVTPIELRFMTLWEQRGVSRNNSAGRSAEEAAGIRRTAGRSAKEAAGICDCFFISLLFFFSGLFC